MKYIIDCPEGIHKKVLQLIVDGKYATMQDIVIAAIQNQLILEELTAVGSENTSQLLDAGLLSYVTDKTTWKLSTIDIDAVLPITSSKVAMTSDWLFGQVNRVLPIKFGIRILIAMLQNTGETIPLDWFHEKASAEARKFGRFLEKKDEEHSRDRTERLSVGFPTGDLSKSLQRYISHFLGYQQPTTGRLVGALPTLNFVAILNATDGGSVIGVTNEGMQFGLLPNPVIDDDIEDISMSHDEASFYVYHVKEHAPSESHALRTILSLVYKGNDRLKLMDFRMKDLFPNWSDTQRATNRSGTIGRAVDLGLVVKQKKGLEVQYRLSELGSDMLSFLSK